MMIVVVRVSTDSDTVVLIATRRSSVSPSIEFTVNLQADWRPSNHPFAFAGQFNPLWSHKSPMDPSEF